MTTPYREVSTRECRGIAYLEAKRASPWTPQHQASSPPGGPGGGKPPGTETKVQIYDFVHP